jgi:hypothetical protein
MRWKTEEKYTAGAGSSRAGRDAFPIMPSAFGWLGRGAQLDAGGRYFDDGVRLAFFLAAGSALRFFF